MNVELANHIKRVKVTKYLIFESLLFATRYLFKKRHKRKYIVAEPHIKIAEVLEDVFHGRTTRLIINVAPRYGKTDLAVKYFIATGLALNPAAKFIHLTYSAKLALDNSEEAKDIVTSEAYQELFPEVQIKKDSKAKDKWYTTAGGGVYAAATGGQVTGFGAGKVDDEKSEDSGIDEETFNEFLQAIETKEGFAGAIIIDDPIKPEDATSDVKRMRINERFETTIRNRVNSRNTPIIIIQQRVHENDLSGYLMDIEPDVWTVLRLPCLKDDGNALWEAKHTVQELQKLNLINSYVFESQYQQQPKPIRRGGEAYKLFKIEKNVLANPVINGLPKLYNPDLPLWLSFDFNLVPYMTCTIDQIEGRKTIQIDEITLASPFNRTEEVCRTFATKYFKHDKGIFITGDPAGKTESTKTEVGQNDYTIIMTNLRSFRPQLRVAEKHPPVSMRISWVNAVFGENFNGLEFYIGSNCIKTIEDFQFGKEASDATKAKEYVTDPVTKQKYQKYHHLTDAKDYFYCMFFANDFSIYQKGGLAPKVTLGKNVSKNSW